MLAVGGSDQAVSIWQLAAKKRFLDLKDHRRVPHTLRFSPDGKTLISLSATELRVWDTTSGVLLRRIDARNHIPSGLIGHDMARMGPNQGESGNSSYDPQEVRSMLALSPDGRKLVSCDFRFIRIWDVSKGLEMLTLRGHAYPIVAAAFNADSSQIVSVDSEGTLKLWDAESPGEWLVRPVLQGVSDISRDGRILVTGVASQTSEQVTSPDDATYVPRPAVDAVEVWQTVTGRLTSRIPLSEQPDFCRRLTLSPSGRYLTIRSDRGARLVKCCDGQEVCRVPADGHDEDKPTYTNFVFSPDERWLAVANYNGSGLWNLAQGRLVYSAGDWAVESFSPDSRRFAARSLLRARAEREEVRVLTADDMNGTLPPSPPKPKPEGPWIGVFDTETGKQTHGWVQRDAHFSGWGPEGVYFAPTGDKLVLWTGWGENRFWDLATGQEHTMHDFSGQDVSYGSDGKDVAVGDLWETARVLDMQSGRCTHLLCSDSDIDMHQQILSDGSVGAVEADPSPCLKVGLTPDNRRLMTASTLGGSIRFWNTKNYQSIVNFGVYDSAAMRDPGGIRMSENLLTVSLGANDAIVLHAFPKRMAGLGIPAEAVWRREVALLFLNESPRIETQFSPDGRWLAVPMSNSRYGGFAIHDASDGRLVVQIPETGANAAFSPDGRYFAVTVPAAQIALWEIARGWTVQPHHLVSLKVGNDNDPSRLLNTSLAFSPDGKWLAVDHCLWECPELRQVAQMDLPSDVCVFDQHGQIYAIRLGEKTVFGAKKPQDAVVLSHRPAAEIKNSPPPSPAAGLPFAQIPSGRETSRKWDEQQQAELGRWEELVKSGNDMWTIADDVLSIRETAGGPTTTFCVTAGRLLSVAPDGRWVAIASGASDSFGSGVAADEQVTGRPPLVAFDRKTKQARNLLTEKELAVVRLESSADGRYLLAWTSCGQSPLHPDDPGYEESLLSNALARLFDMNEYREVSFAEDASVATGFSHDGRRLAWANDSGEIHVFDLASREIVARLAGHSSYVNSLRFSPDDRLIATASDDRTIRLWDLGEGKEAAVIPDHDGAVSWAEFNADGSRLASYALDGTLRLWDVKYLLAKPVAPKWLEAPTFPNDDQIEQLLPSAGNGEGQKSTAGKAAPAEPPEKARPQAADDSLDRKVVIAMLQQGVRILVTTETPGNRGSADGPWDFDGLPPGCAFVSQETELPAQAFRLVGIDAPQLLGKETIESLNGAESLRYLTLRNFQGGKEIGESLARLRALRGLSLFESGCTDEQFQCLAGLRQLESLSIQRTSVGDPSMKLIAGFINLRVLVVNDTPITDAGFESLKSLKSLEALHATGTLLKGSGFVAFESLPALHTLHLSVSRGIDDQALAIIGRLRNLRTLGLAGTSVSAQGVARLRAELPKCRFVLDTQLEEQVNKLTGSPPAGDGSDSDCR
jgi:WD40 repeat protein